MMNTNYRWQELPIYNTYKRMVATEKLIHTRHSILEDDIYLWLVGKYGNKNSIITVVLYLFVVDLI